MSDYGIPIDGLDGMLPHESREAVLERELMLKDAEIAKLRDDLKSAKNNAMADARARDFKNATGWISVDDRLPEPGEIVMVFRPQVLTDDHTDKPIREAAYLSEHGRFDCYHQPTKWIGVGVPCDWNADLDSRQKRGAIQ